MHISRGRGSRGQHQRQHRRGRIPDACGQHIFRQGSLHRLGGRPVSYTHLFTASLPQGFGNSVWEAHSGLYPTLKAFSGTDEAAVASAAITFAEGESTRVMKKQASLAAPAGVRWYVMSGGELTDISQGLMKDGSTLSLRGVYALSLIHI